MGRDFEFLEAARVGDLLYFEKFFANKKTKALQSLRRGPTSNTQDSSGYSALHHAALNGHLDIVQILLLHDANPNILDGRGSSPLHLAAWAGYQEICRLLLESPNTTVGSANVNALTSQRETSLHFACQFGHVKVVATLLEYDAAPDFVTLYGETPLDLAAKFGRMDVVQLMVYAFPDAAPYGLVTPLHLAARNGHQGVCEFLLDMNYVDIDARAPDGTTPLHESIISGHLAISRLLISQGANCHLTTVNGEGIVDMLQQFPQFVIDEFREFLQNSHSYSSKQPPQMVTERQYIEDSRPVIAKKPVVKLRHEEKMRVSRNGASNGNGNGNGAMSGVLPPPKKPPRRNPNMSKSMDENMIYGATIEQWHIRLAHDYDGSNDALMVSFNNNRRLTRRLYSGSYEVSTVVKYEDLPTSPTYYDQPPTPTHPPPAPALAERKIFEKLRPLSAEYYLGHSVNMCTPNIKWEFYFEADTKPPDTISSMSLPSEHSEDIPCPAEWLAEIRSQIQKLLEKIQSESEDAPQEPSEEDRFRKWTTEKTIAPPLIDHLVNMGYDDVNFLNNGHVKRDILANINCDSEALDKFMRSISDLPEWEPGAGMRMEVQTALQEEPYLKEFLDNIHLTEYFEVFQIFARCCKEWWNKLPFFTDEEMRIWFEMDKPGHLIRFRTALKEVKCFRLNEEMATIERELGEHLQFVRGNREDLNLPADLAKSRDRAEDEILVLFKGNLVTLTISSQDIRITSREKKTEEVEDDKETAISHKHNLEELLYVYQDGADLTKFGYQLVDASWWEFQTASIVTTARAVLIIAHRFGF